MIFDGQLLRCQMLEHGIVEVVFDNKNEAVNKIDSATIREWQQVINLLYARDDVRAAIITSTKSTFILGSDITELTSLIGSQRDEMIEWCQHANAVFSGFAALPFPTIAAINEYSLGAGFELALSCDYRIVTKNGRVGLPSTQLGLIPCFGGTVRLSRLVGAENAIEWLTHKLTASDDVAMSLGAVDAICEPEHLTEVALQMAADSADGKIDWQKRRTEKNGPLQLDKNEATMAFEATKRVVGSFAQPHYPAPMIIIRVIEETANMNVTEALKTEQTGFIRVSHSPQAKAMLQLFVNDQELKAKTRDCAQKAEKPINQLALIGATSEVGTLAFYSASNEMAVVIKEDDNEALGAAMNQAIETASKKVKQGKLTSEKFSQTVRNLKPSDDLQAVKDADLVIDSTAGTLPQKIEQLAQIENLVSDDTFIAVNSDVLSANDLAAKMRHPERFCIIHLYSPIPNMRLVEVVTAEQTSQQTIDAAIAYCGKIGKTAIVVQDQPGMFINRVLLPFFANLSLLVKEGVDFREIDKVVCGFGWAIGPAALVDVIGIDKVYQLAQRLNEQTPESYSLEEMSVLKSLIDAGRLGKQSGAGFYRYEQSDKARPRKVFDEQVFDVIGKPRDNHKIEPAQIVRRSILALIFETTRLLEQGIVATAAECDMAMVYGVGFPPSKCGVLKYADELMVKKIISEAMFYQHMGSCYEVPERIKTMADNNTTFYGA